MTPEQLSRRINNLEFLVMALAACVTRAGLDANASPELTQRINTLHQALRESGIQADARSKLEAI